MPFDPDRREFLRGAARWLIAGGSMATMVALNGKPGERCTNLGVCDRCGSATSCGLPQAMSYREYLQAESERALEDADG